LGGGFVPRLAFVTFETLVQGLQPELPVSGEGRRLQGPWSLAGMWFHVVFPGLSPAECHLFATISHNICPSVEEGSVDPMV
jgi:hypothetical protein